MLIRPSLLALTLAAVALAGCGSDFDPPSLVNGMRILAVRAEPPFVSPSPGASAVLEAKVVGVAPETELCHAWALCLFATSTDGKFACVDPRLQVELGTDATATATFEHLTTLYTGLQAYQKDNPGLASATAGVPGTLPGAVGPPEVKVLFAVAEAAAFGGQCPATAKAFLDQGCPDRDRCTIGYRGLTVALDPEDRHGNPAIDLLEVDGKALLDGESALVAGKDEVPLLPEWTELTPEGLPVDPTATSGVVFAWFSTAGGFDQQRSYDAYPDNQWSPEGAPAGKTVDVWVVARDGTGGVAWAEVHLQR